MTLNEFLDEIDKVREYCQGDCTCCDINFQTITKIIREMKDHAYETDGSIRAWEALNKRIDKILNNEVKQ